MEHLTSDLPKVELLSKEEEERKARSRKRVFWTIVGINVVLAALVLYEILSMFL